ncbi:hypothetical protein UA08_01552 [Talaromyces atroroseus]|uniref:UBC core domain-containing protein n=1 Tax=Talaromyces atroroseus TaxID=1441469 RepID=A0A1Q5QC31_TALAT|nr:hypothetical protein UA08_01552 [Talaromyces atroroseus]OKL63495.1 hypothetical protein UA08_01552 [Talaromyces atroroseus]
MLTLLLDLSEYPHSHRYLIYSTSATVPSAVVDVLDVVQAAVAGAPLCDLLNTISDALEKAFSMTNHEDTPRNLATADTPSVEDITFLGSDYEMDWEDEFFDEDQQFFGSDYKTSGSSKKLSADLRVAKAAGFKVGYLGDTNGSVIVSISCRIAKMIISEEAMQAWDVQPSQYLVLLLRYPNGYFNTKKILGMNNASSSVQMHVGLCASYKPSMTEAFQAFTRTSAIPMSDSKPPSESQEVGKLQPLFLEAPLVSLLNERFIAILRIRHRRSFSWSGAESFFNQGQGLMADCKKPQDSSQYHGEADCGETLRHLVQNDHFVDSDDLELLSFPLLAMQFTLRHFVKCTKFCLVCHCKIDANFEALKPYVCSKPLCLFQYMSLGMGPSVEWEIRRQPLVVDLLISFAFASAAAGSMVDLPTGLKMMVPRIYDKKSLRSGSFQRSDMQLTVEASEKEPFLSPGDWILIELPGYGGIHHWHCRVEGTNSWPVVNISEPIVQPLDWKKYGDIKSSLSIKYIVHDTNFDDMEDGENKQKVILNLLKSLPDVLTMKTWLDSEPSGSTRLLSSWEKVPPAALDLLRWIVASNTSCIMQDGDISKGNKSSYNFISGMGDYLQFRFAQGSPDKEEKFMSAVREVKSEYPTIFAWHGSSISNWHGIIREGLHFKKVSNGRAYGHGVYMAQHFSTSQQYTGHCIPEAWPNTVLNISHTLSLNEVVNKPSKFVHSSNGIYVVDQIDWIQTRYLFVKCEAEVAKLMNQLRDVPVAKDAGQKIFYTQDPKYIVSGSHSQKIQIPITLFGQSRCRLQEPKKVPKGSKKEGKKRKSGSTEENNNEYADDDDNMSVATLAEDIEILFSDGPCEGSEKRDKGKEKEGSLNKKAKEAATTTGFEPGALTESSITILQPPSYATSSATKALQQRLLQALKVQEKEELDELGWYIDPQLITNPYQWIVELHSFELTHPLGKDLHKARIQSIILEMRFPSDFPMSPPFVRVIRPRLLEFNRGGGGHVTMGGALCMELLTSSGWLPTFSIENLLLSIRLAMCSMDPRPARLSSGSGVQDYSVHEAVTAYIRACGQHGWKIPENFTKMAW